MRRDGFSTSNIRLTLYSQKTKNHGLTDRAKRAKRHARDRERNTREQPENVESRTSCSSPYPPITTLTAVFSLLPALSLTLSLSLSLSYSLSLSLCVDRARITRQPRFHRIHEEQIEQLVLESLGSFSCCSTFFFLQTDFSSFFFFIRSWKARVREAISRRHAANAKSARRRDRRLHVSRLAVRLESSKARLESRASVRRNESHGESQSAKAPVRSGTEGRTHAAPSGSRGRIIIFPRREPTLCTFRPSHQGHFPVKFRLMNRFAPRSACLLDWLLICFLFPFFFLFPGFFSFFFFFPFFFEGGKLLVGDDWYALMKMMIGFLQCLVRDESGTSACMYGRFFVIDDTTLVLSNSFWEAESRVV